MGGTTHIQWQNSGHEVAIHAYKLWQRHLDHRLSATLEHTRDFGLKDLIVPRLLNLVGGSAKWQVKVTNTPAIPWVCHVAVPKLVHLLTCGACGVLCSIVRNTVYCNDIVTYCNNIVGYITKYHYNTLTEYTQDTVLRFATEIRTEYMLNTYTIRYLIRMNTDCLPQESHSFPASSTNLPFISSVWAKWMHCSINMVSSKCSHFLEQ